MLDYIVKALVFEARIRSVLLSVKSKKLIDLKNWTIVLSFDSIASLMNWLNVLFGITITCVASYVFTVAVLLLLNRRDSSPKMVPFPISHMWV